ncbi:MAG: ABC transporter ATP-binding protein [Candidatus Thermoplasmatota archaeon]|nr:ABC transporter ATP-binding protein [Candidatus Thermoplasmatota archaeon]
MKRDKEEADFEHIIKVRGLVKTYGKVNAVDGISLGIQRGEVFAFLGPNGAGKTTTVEMIEGIRTPSAGSITVLGKDLSANQNWIKARIGVLPQEFSSFDNITVRETLKFYASLYARSRDIDDLINLMHIKEHTRKLYKNLSGGLKQRIGIAVALVNDPVIIFLDEPTTGLDPAARQEVWKVIKGLKSEGKTVFLTTHYMEEAQELADHVAIINHGKIIAEGSVDELIDRYGKGMVLSFTGAERSLIDFLKEAGCGVLIGEKGCNITEGKEGQVSLVIENKDQLMGILELIRGAGLGYKGINVRRSNMEEVFLSLTGESLKEGGVAP